MKKTLPVHCDEDFDDKAAISWPARNVTVVSQWNICECWPLSITPTTKLNQLFMWILLVNLCCSWHRQMRGICTLERKPIDAAVPALSINPGEMTLSIFEQYAISLQRSGAGDFITFHKVDAWNIILKVIVWKYSYVLCCQDLDLEIIASPLTVCWIAIWSQQLLILA